VVLNNGALVPAWWSARALAVSRGAAVAAAAAVPFSTALTSVCCAVMLLAWFGSGQAHVTLRESLRQPLGLALALFLVIVAAGMLHGPADFDVRLDAFWGWRKLVFALILFGLFQDERWKKRFIIAFVLVASVGFCLSYAAWVDWIAYQKPWEPKGIVFQNHSTQGMVFSLALLCCHQLASMVSRTARLLLLTFGILFALNVIFISTGRSGYLALAMVSAVIALSHFGWRRLPLIALAGSVVIAIVFAVSPVLQQRVKQVLWEATHIDTTALTSIGFRKTTYQNSLELIAERPVFGHGTGSFGTVYSAHVAEKYDDWRAEGTTDPHSQYLFIGVENGLLGVVIFVGFLGVAYLTRGIPQPYLVTGLGALAVWTLTSVFNSHFRTFPDGHLIGLFMGAMLAGGTLKFLHAGADRNAASG